VREVRTDSERWNRRRQLSRILLVDDDQALRETLARALALEGYTVETAEDGIDAISRFDEVAPDVVVLDVLMPNLDGIAACRLIRQQSDLPILMLTARDEVSDRIRGLEAGADDYLGKPFAIVELLARLRALLRRTSVALASLRYADLELDPGEQLACRGARSIPLTRMEFALLEFFLRNPRRALERAMIFREVWGYDAELSSNTLDVFVSSLRRKTEADGEPRLIHTVRGIGYALRDGDA
jgi:two-component system, OmpR family, response regulator MprA